MSIKWNKNSNHLHLHASSASNSVPDLFCDQWCYAPYKIFHFYQPVVSDEYLTRVSDVQGICNRMLNHSWKLANLINSKICLWTMTKHNIMLVASVMYHVHVCVRALTTDEMRSNIKADVQQHHQVNSILI